jgi:hypothetical protein
MTRTLLIRAAVLASAFTLAGCGGGGGSYVASTPPPPATPPPITSTLVLVPAATTDQQFTVTGAARLTPADPSPHLGAADQMQVRYIASSNTYEVQLPNTQSWIALTQQTWESEARGGGVIVSRQTYGQFSSIIYWTTDNALGGVEAIGIATPAGAVPITGSATYKGLALGPTSEGTSSKLVDPSVFGSITLNFDFARGSLSGSLNATLDPEWHDYQLGTLSFRDTVYSTGSTSFSGKFDTNLSGVNSFNGLFTGPNAQELIGNFAFPYTSPVDGLTYQAGGAFFGKQ